MTRATPRRDAPDVPPRTAWRRLARLSIAWTGAAFFLASLLFAAWSYTVSFDARRSRLDAGAALFIDFLLFTIFATHHSLFARDAAKRAVGRVVPSVLERSLYTWVASLLLIAVCLFWEPVPGVVYRLAGGWRVAAFAVQLAGVWVTIRSSAALDVLDLAGVRPVSSTQRPARARPRNARPLRLRPASPLLRLGTDGRRRSRHDRHACGVRADQYRVPRRRDSVGGAEPGPDVWRGLPGLSAADHGGACSRASTDRFLRGIGLHCGVVGTPPDQTGRRTAVSPMDLPSTPLTMPDTPQTPPLPAELPIVPIRGAVVLPMTVAPLGISRPLSVEAVNRALAGDRMVLLLLQRTETDDPGPDDLHTVGTVAILRQMAKAPNGMRVLVEGVARARVDSVTAENGFMLGRRSRRCRSRPNGPSKSTRTSAASRSWSTSALHARNRPVARHQGAGLQPRRSTAARLPAREPPRHEAGGQADAARRGQPVLVKLTAVSTALSREIEVLELKGKIESRAEKEMTDAQRQYLLRQQMKAIQTELGEGESEAGAGDPRARRRGAPARTDRAGRRCARSIAWIG